MVTGMAAIQKDLDTLKADKPFMKISKYNLMAPQTEKKKNASVKVGEI